jgi:hypothetical protein
MITKCDYDENECKTCQYLSDGFDCRVRDERRVRSAAPDLLAALYSALNLESAALLGKNYPSMNGLDVKYHFDKIRAAIRKAEGKE